MTALRGYGPRVFISYSFRDAAIAEQIGQYLSDRGFQVRREDETSLTDQRLSDALPKRIAEAEVLLQILTATANASDWVAREFAYAAALREKEHGIVILPVVLDKASVPDAVKEWWFLDAEAGGVTDSVLAMIERVCLTSVHLLPLDGDNPFQLREADALTWLGALRKGDRKRVIVDSDTRLIGWTEDTLCHFSSLEDPEYEPFLAQERKRLERLIRRQRVIDEVIRKLAIETAREVVGYSTPEDHLADMLKPLQIYSRIAIGDDLIRAADMAPPAPHPLRTDYEALIETARSASSRNHTAGYCNPGFYAWAFGIDDGEDAIADMGMSAPGFRSIKVMMPRRVFGEMEDAYTRYPGAFSPRSELLAGTFLNYVLPQIAIHATYNLVDPDTVRADLETQYAWRLKQYDRMGLS